MTIFSDILFLFSLSQKDIDIKKVNGAPQYAFLQYCDIASVCKAIKKMDGEYLGNNRLKVNLILHLVFHYDTWHDKLSCKITAVFILLFLSWALERVCLRHVFGWMD